MCIHNRGDVHSAEHGISLIELLIFIVVIGIALSGIIFAMNLNTSHSVDPLLRKQALTVAESLLEEIESESVPFTSVDNYDSLHLTGGDSGNPTSDRMPVGYSALVTAVPDSSFGASGSPLAEADVRRITVTVKYNAGHDTITLEGYRTHY